MTLNEQIITAVTPVVPVCVPDLLITEASETPPDEYCTFRYDDLADALGDDSAHAMRALVQVHFLAPLRANTVETRRKLWTALAAVEEFSPADVTNASDQTGQHYVFEFDALEGVADG